LANISHKVGRGTVANVLKRNGIEPAPERSKRTTWSTFLKAHWKVFAASDLFGVEVWTMRGFVTQYVLFVIGSSDRHVERNHQRLANRLIRPQSQEVANHGAIYRRQRLGGMSTTTIARLLEVLDRESGHDGETAAAFFSPRAAKYAKLVTYVTW